MSTHDFTELYVHYPAVIAQMPATFTTHEFIRRLAQHNQTLYIEALYAYRHSTRQGEPTPFMMVHGTLATHLDTIAELENLCYVPSTDIFGQSNECVRWRKIEGTHTR